jgi:hypothetical protein
MFALVPLLDTWHEEQPSNQTGPESSVTWEVMRICLMSVGLLMILFFYHSTLLLFGCILNGTLCIMIFVKVY